MEQEIKILKHSLNEVDIRKDRTSKDSKVMASSAVEEENKTLDPITYKKVEDLVGDLYRLTCGDKNLGGAEGGAKMGNAGVL
jgi:hypothetical protein